LSYIGKTPTVGNFIKLDSITTSSTNSYTLQHNSVNFSPESALHMMVSLNGVIQSPNTSFSVSGSTITFIPASGTLSSSDSIDFIMVYGNVLDIGTPSDATVTNAKTNFVSTSSSAGLQIKGDGTTDGTLQLNCSQNSHGIKLKSPPHSASASYTLTFPNNDGDASQFLQTNGSGVLTWADASAGLNKIVTNTESSGHDYINIDGCFTSTYENYLIVGTANITYGNTNIGIRVRASGSTATGSLYSRNIAAMFASSYSDAAGQSYMAMSYNDLITANANWFFYVYAPQLAKTTYVSGMMTSANLHSTSFSGYVATTSQYDGIQIYNANTGAGDLNTSKVTVYGLAQ
tara:strand:+ start:352 stop:1389 length:1038 start_codon:yes stop_codon:yes gene_type:complete